jgi:hypothetical protein
MLRTRSMLLALPLALALAAPTLRGYQAPVDPVSHVRQDPGMRPIQCSRNARRPDPVARRIERGGGAIQMGRHRFEVQDGSLSEAVSFTFTVVPSDSAIFEIKPSGTTFSRPARLSVQYADLGCNPNNIGDRVELWRIDDDGTVTDVIPAVHDRGGRRITASGINHLSRYLIVSGRSDTASTMER